MLGEAKRSVFQHHGILWRHCLGDMRGSGIWLVQKASAEHFHIFVFVHTRYTPGRRWGVDFIAGILTNGINTIATPPTLRKPTDCAKVSGVRRSSAHRAILHRLRRVGLGADPRSVSEGADGAIPPEPPGHDAAPSLPARGHWAPSADASDARHHAGLPWYSQVLIFLFRLTGFG